MDIVTRQRGAEYDYDRAFRMIAAVEQAAASDEFHAGVIAGYELAGHPAAAAKFTAAVAEQRAFAADQDEHGSAV